MNVLFSCSGGYNMKPGRSSKKHIPSFSYLWLVGNGGMGYNYNYYYYHSSIPY